MLIALIAAQDSANVAEEFVDCLESRNSCSWPTPSPTLTTAASRSDLLTPASNETLEKSKRAEVPLNTPRYPEPPTTHQNGNKQKYEAPTFGCEEQDARWLNTYPNIGPAFSCFREELEELLGNSRNKTILRVAVADFLFHYKSAELYPQDFVAYNRGASAQKLDTLFNPLLVEFNRDLAVYLENLNTRINSTHDKKIEYRSEGMIRVSVLSGAQAKVTTTTQSFFPQPPVISTRDFLNAVTGGGNPGIGKNSSGTDSSGNSGGDNSSGGGSSGGTGIASLLTSNLAPVPAAAVMALVQSAQSKTAQIGRDLNLAITANALSGASAADLDVELNSSEHDQPKLLDQNKNSSNDNLDRVAVHNTSTKVRVDSLKLFEVSAFSATLTRGRSVPLIPPFIDLPYIGNLARLRLPPGTVYHRSFAIVTAVVVPTAADIANSIEFRADLEAKTLPKADLFEIKQGGTAKGKSMEKPTGTATTTIQVQQNLGTNTPLSLQLGCAACSSIKSLSQEVTPKDSKDKTEEDKVGSDNSSKSRKRYYWIVTHYHEGTSVAGPLEVSVGAKTGKETRLQPEAQNHLGTQRQSQSAEPHTQPATPEPSSKTSVGAKVTKEPSSQSGATNPSSDRHLQGLEPTGIPQADTRGKVSLAWDVPPEALSFDLYVSDDSKGDLLLIASGLRDRHYDDPVLSVSDVEKQCTERTEELRRMCAADAGIRKSKCNRYDAEMKTSCEAEAKNVNEQCQKRVAGIKTSCGGHEWPYDTFIYSQLAAQPRNLLEFHNRKLDCLAAEAELNPKFTSDQRFEAMKTAECEGDKKPTLSNTPVTR